MAFSNFDRLQRRLAGDYSGGASAGPPANQPQRPYEPPGAGVLPGTSRNVTTPTGMNLTVSSDPQGQVHFAQAGSSGGGGGVPGLPGPPPPTPAPHPPSTAGTQQENGGVYPGTPGGYVNAGGVQMPVPLPPGPGYPYAPTNAQLNGYSAPTPGGSGFTEQMGLGTPYQSPSGANSPASGNYVAVAPNVYQSPTGGFGQLDFNTYSQGEGDPFLGLAGSFAYPGIAGPGGYFVNGAWTGVPSGWGK